MSLTHDQKAQLLETLFDGLKEEIKQHLHAFHVQKSADAEHVQAEHHRLGLHQILDVYETSYDILQEILDNYH
jgi:hypothetical protein